MVLQNKTFMIEYLLIFNVNFLVKAEKIVEQLKKVCEDPMVWYSLSK
jgi:hypothetical protein